MQYDTMEVKSYVDGRNQMADQKMSRAALREQREKERKQREQEERREEMNERVEQVKDKVSHTVKETTHRWLPKREKKVSTRSSKMAKDRERNRFLNRAILIVGILLAILIYLIFYGA